MASTSTTFDTDCVLMLHCNGADGSTTFTDSSFQNTKTVTANGDAQIDTAISKFGGASGLYDQTGDYLSIPDSTDWDFGTGNFTIDFWVNFAQVVNSHGMMGQKVDASNLIRIGWDNATSFEFIVAGSGISINVTKSWVPLITVWYHVAIIRGWGGNANDFAVTIDGTQIGTTVTDTDSMPDLAASWMIGTNNHNSDWNGSIDEIRIVKGTAVWTANFTAPSAEYNQAAATTAKINKLMLMGIG